MNPSILIRTHAPDIPWLDWCLKSCNLRVPDLPITVVCPEKDYAKVKLVTDPWDTPLSGVAPFHKDGYIDQQWTKLNADHFCPDASHIIHVDSDCVWADGWESLFKDGKPVLLKTPYTELVGDGAAAWQTITEESLGLPQPIEFEYMRRHPLVYPTGLYAKVRRHMRGLRDGRLEDWFRGIANREFSEFNVIGAFADYYTPEDFHWIDTSKSALPGTVMRQGWSWGGMTDEVLKEWGELVR